ncbi:UDP-N-acetylglucosamine pyrophosphorylase [Thermocrinis albus DSM 14484]|uniref:Bifunctional protein GlmU n=1 Tax=Thermocrinis albus (strain DSM 14484 / JCM 11386 / HI 11/12) TaxID=638303 RepID=D3SMN4_THEAH|nr:bifunctional UDP-N-acetylglucosamine diphosphorylase/glucosamine-1-phosphate N-acetyltransferase GlmU [Thermocrinis albus]ADC90014.1 UDP-N-acetylglucosamine pyrophosphorylase [Thermocrinis albus DSM 14484]
MRGLVLAAGLGTRFKSEKPKVLYPILGKPMVWYAVSALEDAGIKEIALVVSDVSREVMNLLGNNYRYFMQSNPKGGTADAVISALDFWRDYDGYLLVINGDTPAVKASTLKSMVRYLNLVKEYEGVRLSALLLSSFLPDPTGYGRVIKDEKGNVIKVVEEKDASAEEKLVNEINGGVYLFYCPHLLEVIFHIKPSRMTGELYLTEVFHLMYQKGYVVRSFMAEDPSEIMGVNDRWDLAVVENVLRLRILQKWAKEGNTVHQPESVYIEPDVKLEGDVEIEALVSLKGNTVLKRGCKVGKGSVIENSILEENVVVEPYSVIKNSHIKKGAIVGPFAHVRDNSVIGEASHIGNFVEVKKSSIGKEVKAKHLAYIGDAFVGDLTNIGAGVVFANYDGKRKYETYVGKGAFIGSNSLLIAPIKLGDYSYVAGGSVINKNVEEGDLAIGRARMRVIKGKGKEKLLDDQLKER